MRFPKDDKKRRVTVLPFAADEARKAQQAASEPQITTGDVPQSLPASLEPRAQASLSGGLGRIAGRFGDLLEGATIISGPDGFGLADDLMFALDEEAEATFGLMANEAERQVARERFAPMRAEMLKAAQAREEEVSLGFARDEALAVGLNALKVSRDHPGVGREMLKLFRESADGLGITGEVSDLLIDKAHAEGLGDVLGVDPDLAARQRQRQRASAGVDLERARLEAFAEERREAGRISQLDPWPLDAAGSDVEDASNTSEEQGPQELPLPAQQVLDGAHETFAKFGPIGFSAEEGMNGALDHRRLSEMRELVQVLQSSGNVDEVEIAKRFNLSERRIGALRSVLLVEANLDRDDFNIVRNNLRLAFAGSPILVNALETQLLRLRPVPRSVPDTEISALEIERANARETISILLARPFDGATATAFILQDYLDLAPTLFNLDAAVREAERLRELTEVLSRSDFRDEFERHYTSAPTNENLVDGTGSWDYKQYPPKGVYEDFGNFMYGFLGRLSGVWSFELHGAAALLQSNKLGVIQQDGIIEYTHNLGDDSYDAPHVRLGIAVANELLDHGE